jgi:hypothetical protein
MALVDYKICKLYAEKSANLSMLKCANFFRQINQSYSNCRVCKSFAGLYSLLILFYVRCQEARVNNNTIFLNDTSQQSLVQHLANLHQEGQTYI